MRLQRLHVSGFGRLIDQAVDFGSDLTVILGANESGKSTVHRAVRAALYGIDAGGQGRPVERSEWQRWAPWGGREYGLTLTYALADGRQVRVARSLRGREQSVQVQELGGGDLTDQLRLGRSVVPGQFHLGMDEGVFCATACLGEDGLRADAADGAAHQVRSLQEAIERLADSGSGTSAAQAVARLREAAQRVGSERRQQSPLGAATLRVRRLDGELADARRRVAAVAEEQQRLRRLDQSTGEAERTRRSREREWLVGKLAALSRVEAELADARDRIAALESELAELTPWASFPLEEGDRVVALGAELAQVEAAEAEALERGVVARERLRVVDRRRSEVAAGRRVLAGTPEVAADTVTTACELRDLLAAQGDVRRHADALRAAESRAAATRREIAGLGLGSVPVGATEAVAALLETAAGGRPGRLEPAASAAGLVGAGFTGVALAAGHRLLAAAGLLVFGVMAVALHLVARFGGGRAEAAVRELRRRCPGLDTSPAGIRRALERIDAVAALHLELQRQDVLAQAGRDELAGYRDRIAELAGRCRELASGAGVEIPPPTGSTLVQTSAEGVLAHARAILGAIDETDARWRRLGELADDDVRLSGEARDLQLVIDESERRSRQRTMVEATLRRLLLSAGIRDWSSTVEAIDQFRDGCNRRRRFESARDSLVEVRRRVVALATDEGVIGRLRAEFTAQLRARGGDLRRVEGAEPLSATALQQLETGVEHARRAAIALRGEAEALRARLSGLLEGLPCVADLEDERAAAALVRERSLRQLAALDRAAELIEAATRGVHRQVAPRLAAYVTERLGLLTDGRWTGVDVDTDRFTVVLESAERPELVPLELVSHGTRDQVSLLLRMALCDVLGDGGEPVPLLLDEPLLSADPVRRRAAISFLARVAVTNQVVVATADPQTAADFVEEAGGHCAVVELGAGHSAARRRPRLRLAVG